MQAVANLEDNLLQELPKLNEEYNLLDQDDKEELVKIFDTNTDLDTFNMYMGSEC